VKKDKDPLFYYQITQTIGTGSMGCVAQVRKRDGVVGGSARPNLVDSFHRQQRQEQCFRIPLVGGLFELCMKGSAVSRNTKSTSSKLSILSSPSDLSTEASSTTVNSGSTRAADIVYAMKSIRLDRLKDAAFVRELENEIEMLKALDHPHIVRPMETFYHRNQIFVVMELCSG